MSRRLLVAVGIVGLAFALVPPAGVADTAQQPQVVCISSSSPVESPVGFYASRPRSCNFHQPGRPAADAFMVQMRRIHWSQWGPTLAVGRGKSLASMVGPVATTVQLSAPRTVCGHRVFTIAKFKYKSGSFGKALPLDKRPASAACRA